MHEINTIPVDSYLGLTFESLQRAFRDKHSCAIDTRTHSVQQQAVVTNQVSVRIRLRGSAGARQACDSTLMHKSTLFFDAHHSGGTKVR